MEKENLTWEMLEQRLSPSELDAWNSWKSKWQPSAGKNTVGFVLFLLSLPVYFLFLPVLIVYVVFFD